jgi:hypothetical protein
MKCHSGISAKAEPGRSDENVGMFKVNTDVCISI